MNKTYVDRLQYRQQDIPEYFRFYFKHNKKKTIAFDIDLFRDLKEPRLRIAIVTET